MMDQKSKKGASLVIVVCVSAFLVAFSLAMIYTAGLILSGANRRLIQERCYQLAKSFAQTLDEELYYTDPDTAPGDSFYRFACTFLEDDRYAEYNPDRPEDTSFYYKAGSYPAGEEYGDITVILYKEGLSADSLSGEFSYDTGGIDENGITPAEIMNQKIFRYAFTVEVVADIGDVTYRYATEYQQEVTYQDITFKHNDTVIIWNENEKQWYKNSTTPYGQEGVLNITYEFKPGFENLKTCVFQKAIADTPQSTEGENP